MPFLFPALAAAVCDTGILYLGHRNYLIEQEYAMGTNATTEFDDDDDTKRRVYHYGYIVTLAAIRLFLLLVPLPYHSFFGKALRCPLLYRLFYGTTLVVLGFHALTLLMIDPSSLSSLLEALRSYSHDDEEPNSDASRTSVHHILVTQSLWVALILTLISTLSHFALFFHVRSTAPLNADLFGGSTKRRPKVLLYYAKEKNQHGSNHHPNGHHRNTERESLLSHNGGSRSDSFPNEDDPIGLPMNHIHGNGHHHHGENGFYRNSAQTSSGRNLQEISKKLVAEFRALEVRLRTAKRDWTKRLEDYQKSFREVAANAAANAARNSGDRLPLHHPNRLLQQANRVAPFRVILELFAGDHQFLPANGNNSSNDPPGSIGKLDAVYDLDDGAALMLFVPQLLSFLLHGAYESSHPLEEWILETCRKNLFFAHQCYWFLRAWSLETSSVPMDGSYPEPVLLSQQQVTRLSHSSSLASFATQEEDKGNYQNGANTHAKLLPEERAVIEELMRKIMKCGEEPARRLHFGSTQFLTAAVVNSSRSSSSSLRRRSSYASTASSLTPASAAAQGHIPVNPQTGVPSPRHFECLAARKCHGFLPIDNGAVLTASYHQSILNGDPCGTSYFDSCPVFLDALLTIADNLFKVPRAERKSEFRKQLRLLEVEALPCNEVYIPLQNLHHRVWRIVAEESIAISTKERVPCIVCLEVLGYPPETEGGGKNDERDIFNFLNRPISDPTNAPANTETGQSEREMVEEWRNRPRDPYRRETALQRVTHGMGKIPDKMKVTMEEMQTSMHVMQESIRQGIVHIRETAENSSIGSVNEFWNATDRSLRDDEDESSRNDDVFFDAKTFPESPKPKRDIETGGSPCGTAEASSPSPKASTQPSTPKTPRTPLHSSIQQGAMGQWTKSPAPKGSLASPNTASKGEVVDISEAVMASLSAPAIKSKQQSYQTVNSHPVGNTISRRRLSRTNISSRPDQIEVEIHGSSSSHDYDYDDENDYSDHYSNGVFTPIMSNHKNGSNHSPNSAHSPPKPPAKPPPVVFKENWKEKEDRLRSASAYGNHPGWKLLPVLVKSNDDLRQEQLASQLIQRMALILARDQIPVWLCPYEILALDANGGIIEAIPDTISLASLKKNDPDYTDLKGFFEQYFYEADTLADAKANFCESLAAYSIVCFLLQIKDRHNGNILLDNRGHLIHIDFGFFFLSSPGKNTGFESAPFKLTREFVTVLGGPESHLFGVFRTLCYRTFISLRKHCHEIILLVEMLQLGNEDLACFRGRPEDAIRELRQRFRLDLNDRACLEYVNALIDESLENWRTNWYDRYQRYCVGVL